MTSAGIIGGTLTVQDVNVTDNGGVGIYGYRKSTLSNGHVSGNGADGVRGGNVKISDSASFAPPDAGVGPTWGVCTMD